MSATTEPTQKWNDAGGLSDDVWIAIVGPMGPILRMALAAIVMVPSKAIAEAIGRIEHETSIGPMLNPTAYLNGVRFENGRKYQEVLRAVLALQKAVGEQAQ